MTTAVRTLKVTEKAFKNRLSQNYQRAELCLPLYSIKIAETAEEIESALRLRYEVFCVELNCQSQHHGAPSKLEFDEYDTNSKHLIVIDNATGKTVGTYRMNSLETVKNVDNFYSYTEFSVENLPPEVLSDAVEIGRACVAKEHRNARVLLLLWKGLLNYLAQNRKRFFFGCCSIFTQNRQLAGQVFCSLIQEGFLHDKLRIEPRADRICLDDDYYYANQPLALPSLFKSYLKSGAKICGAPIIDVEFKTIDFFVIFDITAIDGKYQKLLFS